MVIYLSTCVKTDSIKEHLDSLGRDHDDKRVRLISFLSAAIAVSRPEITGTILAYLKGRKISDEAVYETILQSYLFLGFPRMIEAAIVYNDVYGNRPGLNVIGEISPSEAKVWYRDGLELCRKVYGKNYDRLCDRFIAISPEIFRWMVIEGYGKVLTRPGLTSIERELAEVAALIVDQRERQLMSHIVGSLNVGALPGLIHQVNEDIKSLSGRTAFKNMDKMISEIELKYETTR
jgi:alkylhydroperoxidase/carboxymuconolactone decarboxylase family protein YurZ